MKLKLLTEDPSIMAMCQEYWSVSDTGFQRTVAAIASDHSISSYDLSKIVKTNVVAYSEDSLCKACNSPYQYTSRTDFNSHQSHVEWLCNDCLAEQRQVESQRLADERQEKAEQVLNILQSAQAHFQGRHSNIEDLGIKEAVYLLSLIRHSMSEDLSHIKEYENNSNERLGLDPEHDREIVKEIYNSELIYISPSSDLSSVELVSETQFRFNLGRVQWHLTIGEDVHPSQYIAQLENKMSSMEFLESHHEEIVDLSKEIALKECLFYLNHVLDEHKLPFKPGDKTKLVLSTGLSTFSVAQMYNFIWRAAKDAASFHLRKGVAKNHAANTVVGNIGSQIERAVANSWDVQMYRRNYDYPQTIVSRVFYNTLLHTDDGGFTQVLNKII